MLRILFIKPYIFLHPNQNLEIPIGIISLSAYIKKEFPQEVDIKIFDERINRESKSDLTDLIRNYQPDIIGISIMSFEREWLPENLEQIHNAAPDAFYIAGGPYPTMSTNEIFERNPLLDLAVRGEGEKTLGNIVYHFLKNSDYRSEDGISFRSGKDIIHNPDRQVLESIEDLPMPDYGLIEIEKYWNKEAPMNLIIASEKHVIIMTSRSCPYKCVYCHNMMGKGFRPKSALKIFEEMNFLWETYGIDEFDIVDDIFNLDHERMRELGRLIISSGRKWYFAFPNATRGDILTEEDLVLLKKIGCYSLTVSIETASPRWQEKLQKNLNIERSMKNVAIAHSLGIITRGYFMVGFPGETKEEIKRTLKLARSNYFDMVSIFQVVPFEDTVLSQWAREEYGEYDATKYADYFAKKSIYEEYTGLPLKSMVLMTYIRFYLPFRIFRTLLRMKKRSSFFKRVLSGLRMLFAAYKSPAKKQ